MHIESRAHYYFILPIIMLLISCLSIPLNSAHFVLLYYYCINMLHRSATLYRYCCIHTSYQLFFIYLREYIVL